MLLVISPAKNLDYETPIHTRQRSQPVFLDEAASLVEDLQRQAPQQLSQLMKISDKLGVLNYDRYQQWKLPFTPDNARQALLAFNGDVYTGLDARSLVADDLKFAQQHLRILSGLYGVLRPLDLMQAYRLEMGTRFANPRGADLYAFWGPRITTALNKQLRSLGSDVLVNLASQEYFKSVQVPELRARVVTPVFKDWKGDGFRIISFFAKKARGLMTRYVIRERITEVEQLKRFDLDGYRFNEALSSADNWTFTRR